MTLDDRSDLDALDIVRGSKADISSLEPLWVAVHHVHRASMPELAPYVSDEETWREHRALYVELFRKQETFLFLARARDELVGYALGHVLDSAESWWSDTWQTRERVGELESISVLPDHLGTGIGSALLDAVEAEFAGSASTTRSSESSRATSTQSVSTSGGGSDPRGSTCPASPVVTPPVRFHEVDRGGWFPIRTARVRPLEGELGL